MISTLIFDWGGVLTKGKHTDGITRILEKKFNVAEINVANSNTVDSDKKTNKERVAHLVDMIDYKGASFQEFVEELNKEFQINSTVEEIAMIFAEAIVPNDEMIEFLNDLKKQGKYRIVLLSDNNETTIKILKTMHKNMLIPFERMYFSCEVKMHKPELRFFQFVLSDLNLQPEECVFIDDQEKNTKAASGIGIKSVLFRDCETLKKELKFPGMEL